ELGFSVSFIRCSASAKLHRSAQEHYKNTGFPTLKHISGSYMGISQMVDIANKCRVLR
ncbi:DNA integrity scanning protein DisA, partial [Clarias magur]